MNIIELNPMQKACAKVGSQKKMAELLGVSAAYVNQLCRTGAAVPSPYCPSIELETGVSRKDLRPDDWQQIWPDLLKKLHEETCSEAIAVIVTNKI